MLKTHLFVITQSWPCKPYGGSIAVTASLRQYEAFFEKVVFICLNENQPELNHLKHEYPRTRFVHIKISRGGFIKRFIEGAITGIPAITVGLAGTKVYRKIKACIEDETIESAGSFFGVIDDNVPSIHLPALKRDFPRMRWAFRSHDVLHRAFSVFQREGSLLMRLAWSFENWKIYRFEKRSTYLADVNWTITEDDRLLSERVYGKEIDGVFDSEIDIERYGSVSLGESRTVLYLGSADQRKSHGLRRFIQKVWPVLHREIGDIRFLLGGKRTDAFNDPSLSIEGHGFIDNELAFLGKGLFFLNPQKAGSGLKLKSLVAMASGKLLVTTPNGALGLGGEAEKHYVVASDEAEMFQKLRILFNDPVRALEIAQAGRDYVHSHFSSEAFSARIQPLLNDFTQKKPRKVNA